MKFTTFPLTKDYFRFLKLSINQLSPESYILITTKPLKGSAYKVRLLGLQFFISNVTQICYLLLVTNCLLIESYANYKLSGCNNIIPRYIFRKYGKDAAVLCILRMPYIFSWSFLPSHTLRRCPYNTYLRIVFLWRYNWW